LEEKIFNHFLFLILLISNQENSVLDFANHLYEQEDYYRAITEYKRFIFISNDSESKLYARKRILYSYKNAGRYSDATLYLNTFSDNGYKHMEEGKISLLMDKTQMARAFFAKNSSDTATLLTAWSYILDNDWQNTVCVLDSFSCNPNIANVSQKMVQYAHKADKNIEKKSKTLSALFSMLIPGAGRFYTRRPGDGLFSFLTVMVPGVISYVYWQNDRKRAANISLGLTALFYTANIYGSIISAQSFNEVRNDEYVRKIENDLHIEENFIKQERR